MYKTFLHVRRSIFYQIPKKSLITMKLVIVLTMIALQVSASSYAQKITLNKTNASLEQVFDDIRNQSGYDFFYNLKLIRLAKPVTVKLAVSATPLIALI